MHFAITIFLSFLIMSSVTSCEHQKHDVFEPYPKKYNKRIYNEPYINYNNYSGFRDGEKFVPYKSISKK